MDNICPVSATPDETNVIVEVKANTSSYFRAVDEASKRFEKLDAPIFKEELDVKSEKKDHCNRSICWLHNFWSIGHKMAVNCQSPRHDSLALLPHFFQSQLN